MNLGDPSSPPGSPTVFPYKWDIIRRDNSEDRYGRKHMVHIVRKATWYRKHMVIHLRKTVNAYLEVRTVNLLRKLCGHSQEETGEQLSAVHLQVVKIHTCVLAQE